MTDKDILAVYLGGPLETAAPKGWWKARFFGLQRKGLLTLVPSENEFDGAIWIIALTPVGREVALTKASGCTT